LTRWVEAGAPWPPEAKTATKAGHSGADWEARKRHWSLLPVRAVEPPVVRDASWPSGPIDRFLLAGLEANGLAPAADLDRRSWIRRVTFDLIGLPPKPEEVEAFANDPAAGAHERVVDHLLASPHYGERWARHWLDLVRYAETSGYEFDFDILDAWRYRDYMIRAFNADVPYDRIVVEHLAGDLLADPRRRPEDGSNESILGTGFYFLGEGTQSPLDLREDQATRIAGQIDILGKAFLGLTIACARCHDHKFDAITARDYYALSGILKSSRFQHAPLDPPDRNAPALAELAAIKASLAARLADKVGGARTPPDPGPGEVFEDFSKGDYTGWSRTGEAFGDRPSQAGDLRIGAGDKAEIQRVPSGWAHSGLVSDRLQGTLRSRSFPIERRYLLYRAEGRGGRINLVVDGFEKIRYPIYTGLTLVVDSPDRPRWFVMDLALWKGHRAYVELADGAMVDYATTTFTARYADGDGYLAVDEIRASDDPPPSASSTARDPNPLAIDAPEVKTLVARYRGVESRLARPTLGLTIADGTAEDDRVHIRGSTRALGEVVPRRFLEVFEGTRPTPPSGSGRLELARKIVDPANPLTARVMVNRLWKHHFGEGLVKSTDDFGAMGWQPTHPELLDWLAMEFVREGWSIKRMQRRMVLSHAYRMASVASPEVDRADPTNRWLHRMNVRRLEAEAVRDAMLAVSGRLDPTPFGPPVPTHLTPFMEGRMRPASSGPLDGNGRRSLYLNVRRNFPAPLLLAFDFPTLPTCVGRRHVSNVPAQALTLLNDPFVIGQATHWAGRARAKPGRPEERLDDVYRTAFGRSPTTRERAAALAFVESRSRHAGKAWADLCHVLLNTKGFLFIYRTAFGRSPTTRERAAALAFLQSWSSEVGDGKAWADLCHVLLNTKEFLFIP
jgi:Protein of unknown function (DUF1553)/Protein of unknown function (DUF1549)